MAPPSHIRKRWAHYLLLVWHKLCRRIHLQLQRQKFITGTHLFFLNELYDISTSSNSSHPLTTAENVEELNINGGFFLNTPQAVVQVYNGVFRTVPLQGLLPIHSLGVPSERQIVKLEEIPQERDNSLTVPVRFV